MNEANAHHFDMKGLLLMGKHTIILITSSQKKDGIQVLLTFQSLIGTGCHTEPYMVVVKVRQRSSASKRAMRAFDMERYNLKKLHDVEVKQQYQLKS
jgi:hypothetical protein